jgi:hypothetical protein
MPLLVRTRITAIEPPALALTVQGKARVRVRGQVCGFVQCAGERRFAWGSFDESFQLTRRRGPVKVRAFGLGGVAHQVVRFISDADLMLPRAPALRGKVRWSRPRVPVMAPLSAHTIRTLSGTEDT